MNDIFDLAAGDCAPVYNNTAGLMPAAPWLNELNPEQKAAVTTTEGPVLVLSGAGTGKTKVLTTRLAYLLSNAKAHPQNCLVVTFTNRAATEMKTRAANLIGDMVNSVWMGTFHGICAKILRRHAELVGLKSNFTILGEDDQRRVVKQICDLEGIDDKKYPPQSLLDKIQLWKDKGITVDKIDDNFKNNIVTEVYKKYQARLLELNCVDFGDLLLYTLNILLSFRDVLTQYQERFKYIMIDEYQDTNVTQYLFLRLICQKYRNICCVGDDDQSIYSWRGAEIENILRFEKDFPDAKIIRLERNYRSTANILAAASAVISHNKGRLGKTLKVAENSPAAQGENPRIKVVSTYSGSEEAAYVAEEIEAAHRRGEPYADIAVLVRTAAQTREFEEKFISEAIPYQVIGGPKFYERAEIRDILAYLRVVMQSDDDLALERIINKPARGIGAKTIEKIRQEARRQRCSMYDAVLYLLENSGFSGKVQTNLQQLFDNFAVWKQNIHAVTADELATQIQEDSGYLEMLENDKSPESEGRKENLKELINVMSDHDKYPDLSEFMEHVSLVMDNDSGFDTNKVTLMTLHSAKGLEFDTVFLPGWEESLFPHQRSLDEGGSESLEEERRLAYVAMTRARRHLYISAALNRRIYGQWQSNMPSRFINELPPENIEICNMASGYFSNNNYGNRYDNSAGKERGYYNRNYDNDDGDRFSYEPADDGWGNSGWQNYRNRKSSFPSGGYQRRPAATASPLRGMRVFHETFGYGKILSEDGNKLEILFESCGRKRLLKDYVRKA